MDVAARSYANRPAVEAATAKRSGLNFMSLSSDIELEPGRRNKTQKLLQRRRRRRFAVG